MRTTLAVLSLLATLFMAGSAQAQVYLRGDAGYGWARGAGITDTYGAADPYCVICVSESLNHVGGAKTLGLGVGYRLNDLLRGDVTGTYRGRFDLKQTDGNGTSFAATIQSWSVMAMAYVDVPVEWRGIRPFVGAGIGWANNRMSALQQNFEGGYGSESNPSGGRNNLAWALTAGVGVPVSALWPQAAGWTVDIAYRYADLGRAGTNPGTSTLTFGSESYPLQTSGVTGHLRVNEALASLRYQF